MLRDFERREEGKETIQVALVMLADWPVVFGPCEKPLYELLTSRIRAFIRPSVLPFLCYL